MDVARVAGKRRQFLREPRRSTELFNLPFEMSLEGQEVAHIVKRVLYLLR